ncbi:MAG: FtsL-like putative cell division protein [Bacteroidota bacterium]
MSNEFKNQEIIEENATMEPPKKEQKGRSFLRFFSLRNLFSKENVTGNLSYVFFLGLLAVVYIANSYNSDKILRKIDATQKELKELVSEYGSTKRMLQDSSRQTVVAKKVEALGLIESTSTQKQIVVSQNDIAKK